MSDFADMNTNAMIATLRALTHEIDRVNVLLDQVGLDGELMAELGLYVYDLSCALAVMSDEYENRRKSDHRSDNLMAIENLLNYFSEEKIV